jgi:prophage regulatory protein
MHSTTRLIKRPEVEALTGLRRSTIYDQIKQGKFPRPVHLGPRSVAWSTDDVHDWISSRISESRRTAESGTPS